jgi:hypothetical protein
MYVSFSKVNCVYTGCSGHSRVCTRVAKGSISYIHTKFYGQEQVLTG